MTAGWGAGLREGEPTEGGCRRRCSLLCLGLVLVRLARRHGLHPLLFLFLPLLLQGLPFLVFPQAEGVPHDAEGAGQEGSLGVVDLLVFRRQGGVDFGDGLLLLAEAVLGLLEVGAEGVSPDQLGIVEGALVVVLQVVEGIGQEEKGLVPLAELLVLLDAVAERAVAAL